VLTQREIKLKASADRLPPSSCTHCLLIVRTCSVMAKVGLPRSTCPEIST